MSATVTHSTQTERVLRAFRNDTHVRERLAAGGVLNIDRKLPYLFIYRQPHGRDDAGTDRLVLGEASYLIMREQDEELVTLLRAVTETATAEMGSFLLLEIWAGPPGSREFVIHAPTGAAAATAQALEKSLRALPADELGTDVTVQTTDERHAPGMQPLLSAQDCWEIGCLALGLQVPPIYRDDETGAVYPVFLRRVRHLLSGVLRQTAFEFARVQTKAGFESHRALGPRSFGDDTSFVDDELTQIEQSYQLLLLLSPMNPDEAWQSFRGSRFTRPPIFRYRLLPVDPDILKRRLFALDLDAIADPAMGFLLRDKRDELELQVTLLNERNLPGFRYASMRLYGTVDDVLLRVARDILATVRPPESTAGDVVNAEEFAAHTHAELDYYRQRAPDLAPDVQIRTDMMGLMVSRGDLLISSRLSLHPERVDALIHHEVGTHMLTYYNGRKQPLRQLYTGLAGYDELQEGIAVFTEYLSGGLNAARMRLLAARVVAAHCVEEGAEFLDTFRVLVNEHAFMAGTAFDICERVHQGGGFTRDVIYLRGLLRLVEYLRAGGAVEPLFIGKIAAKHIDIIDELLARGYLVPPALLPRVLELPEATARLDATRRGITLMEMVS